MSRLLLVAAACLCLAHDAIAQSPAPAPAKVAVPAAGGTIAPGTYDLDIIFGGGTMPGVLVLTPQGDSLGVTLQVGEHTSPITSATRKGATLLLTGGGPGLQLGYELRFKGDALTGSFTYNGDRGEVAGKRRR